MHRLLPVLALLVTAACAEDHPVRLIDLEGPRGEATAPGPWGVAVLTDGSRPRVVWSTDGPDAVEADIELEDVGGGQFVGLLPSAEVGEAVRYRAILGDERWPAQDTYRFVVVPPPGNAPDARPPTECALRFTRPVDGATLQERTDDSAPQFGLQYTVRVATDLPPNHAVRLTVGETTYAGRVGVGADREAEVAFDAVTLPTGEVQLEVDAIPPDGGIPCSTGISIQVVPRR